MDKTTAQAANKKVLSQLFSLTPSALINLFEIDITNIAVDAGAITASEQLFNPIAGIYRFHNNVNLINTSLFWQGNEYFALPIYAEGFEFSSSGTLPTPKLRISVNEEGVPLLAALKEKMFLIGDLTGCKVTRKRTFAKYLDRRNFLTDVLPEGFEPDQNVFLPDQIFYIDRKSNENKYLIEFELSSIFDVEGIKLPGRLVIATKCSWAYRGEGCMYEYESRRTAIHGSGSLLGDAPVVANDRDELITDIVGSAPVVDRGKWEGGVLYFKGNVVYLEKNNLKYYFVALRDNPPSGPPNLKYWTMDNCSRTIQGCKLRFKNIRDGSLPTSAFPAVNKLTS